MGEQPYILGLEGTGAVSEIKAAKEIIRRNGGQEAANSFEAHMRRMGQRIRHAFETSNDPVYKWVMANAHRLTPELREKMENGTAKVNRHTLYRIIDIAGLNSIEVFGSGTGEIVEYLCNVNKGLIPVNSNFVADKVRILYGVKANSNDPLTDIDFSEGFLPAGIKSGVVKKLKFHDNPLFGPKYLLENFVNRGENKIEGLMAGEVLLPQYQIVKSNELVSMELAWTKAAPVSSALKVMISGVIISADTE